MTANVSLELKAEMTGALQRLATCMLIERTDGNVYGFTTHDEPITYGGFTYEPAASFNPTDIAGNNNLDVDNLTVEGLLSSDTITEDELRAGRWDHARFRIFRVCWSDLTMGEIKLRAGWFSKVVVNRQTYSVELLGLVEAYGTSICAVTQAMCRASLGDSDCKVSLLGSPSYSVSGTIDSAATDFMTLTDAARTEPDAYFDEGVITFTSGDNIGISCEVKAYIVGLWITKTPYPYDATGATYTMTRGCNRLFDTCRDTFNNVINFQGEPWLRGNDQLVQIGRHN